MSCRDCPRCTEPMLISLVMWPFRFAWWACTFWNIQMVERKCPQCRHPIRWHKLVGGRFQD